MIARLTIVWIGLALALIGVKLIGRNNVIAILLIWFGMAMMLAEAFR